MNHRTVGFISSVLIAQTTEGFIPSAFRVTVPHGLTPGVHSQDRGLSFGWLEVSLSCLQPCGETGACLPMGRKHSECRFFRRCIVEVSSSCLQP